MSGLTVEDKIIQAGFEDIIVFSNNEYDNALIGISEDGRAIYNYDLMVQWLIDKYNFNETDAIEWIDYNTIRALPYAGEKSPIVMFEI